MPAVTLVSTIACPVCEHRETETMPTDACRYVYQCPACSAGQTKARRLLRVLFLWRRALPADPGRAGQRARNVQLLLSAIQRPSANAGPGTRANGGSASFRASADCVRRGHSQAAGAPGRDGGGRRPPRRKASSRSSPLLKYHATFPERPPSSLGPICRSKPCHTSGSCGLTGAFWICGLSRASATRSKTPRPSSPSLRRSSLPRSQRSNGRRS